MLKCALPLFTVIMAMTTPAAAQSAAEPEAWTATGRVLRAESAGITLPQTIANLSLAKSGELSHGGKGIDNYAQYLSDDGAIQATFYVYLPSYADAPLAAHMTDRAIMERFGSKTRRTDYSEAPVGGLTQGAIRAVYDDAGDGALTTAAAFVHAGRWIVKLRITGPTERRSEVLAGLDGMLGGLRFDRPGDIHATAPAAFGVCPGKDQGEARLTRASAAPTDAPLSGERPSPLCIRGRVQTDEGSFDILQEAGIADGRVIVPVDDAGTIVAFDPTSSGNGYRLSIHSVGQTDVYGVYDRIPSAKQIAAILDGKDPHMAQAQRTADYAANGTVTVRAAGAEH